MTFSLEMKERYSNNLLDFKFLSIILAALGKEFVQN